MEFIADFHLHSKFSRATSKQMNLESLDRWAAIKGIKVIGTGDFTHPEWLKELKEKLKPAAPGLFKLKDKNTETKFILTAEVSCVYSKKGKLRKIHLILFSPSFEICEKINSYLSLHGNLKADGRPILGTEAKEVVKIALNVNINIVVIPAHIWTPWFSLFGSKSGFDSVEECFEEYSKYIFAGETGLSSDPAMNWRLSVLDKLTLISCSDAHSPSHIGREACVFNLDMSYFEIIKAIQDKDSKKFLYTIELYPEEGKYHYDGHRLCNISFSPAETKKYNSLCPSCGKPLTIGVLSRVEQLSDRPEGFKPKNAIPFKSLVPLKEIIADTLNQGVNTIEVEKECEKLIKKFGNEFNVLLNVTREDLEKITSGEIAEGVERVRKGNVFIKPGYDGVYGKISLFKREEEKNFSKQGTLFNL